MKQQGMVSIIMAAGKGQRMRNPGVNKVCLDIGGVPAIVRALDTYETAGIGHHVIVVGELVDQVMKAVGERFPNCSYAYQPVPLGTGNAAKVGARVLQDIGYEGAVLVTAGDKYTESGVIDRLIRYFNEGHYDLVLVAGSKDDFPTSGRIVKDSEGAPTSIVEVSEIRLSQAVQAIEAALPEAPEAPTAALLAIINEHFPNERKAQIAFGELWHLLQANGSVSVSKVRQLLEPLRETSTVTVYTGDGIRQIPASEVESLTELANISVYLYRASALYHSLSQLTRDNAQHEEFLTDTIKVLANERHSDGTPVYRLGVLVIDDPEDVMGYNTPEELDQIREVVRRRSQAATVVVQEAVRQIRPLSEWHHLFTADGPEMHAFMDRVYGEDRRLHEQKRQEYLKVIELYRSRLGTDDSVLLVRSPGRINLMGRHIDHRGGRTNMIALSEEVLMVVAPREDDQIHLYNTAEHLFSHSHFSIASDISTLDWGDWLTTVRSPKTLAMVSGGHWANYVRAPAFRLQKEFPDVQLRGANIVAHGTIPVGSGLSSSSAVVVGAAEALIAVNDLPVRPAAMVDLCGEGEWFVGTRGGSGDHAAIKFARRGQVAHVSFFPFEVVGFAPFFPDHALIVCNSGVQAKKAEGARETYNRKVMGYVAGELLFKRFYPNLADRIEHLRDLTPKRLGIPLAEFYRLLKALPVRIQTEELFDRFGPFSPAETEKLQTILSGITNRHLPFEVRGLVLYGIAECERARLCPELLQAGDAAALGHWWNISHDGDRVVTYDSHWHPSPYEADVSDGYLEQLIMDLESGEPQRVAGTPSHLQRGCYACSTPEIDLICDLALRLPGVKGAQISGAGLGGCVMILVESQHTEETLHAFRSRALDATAYAPVEGAGPVSI